MKPIDAAKLGLNISTKFGLPVHAFVRNSSEGEFVIFAPQGVHPNDGFSVRVKIGWRSLLIDFVLGKFARNLLEEMSKSSAAQRALFSKVATEVLKDRASISLTINGTVVDVTNPRWPYEWKSLDLTLKKSPLAINTDNLALTESLINTWCERYFGCLIPLIPLEEIENELIAEEIEEGFPEGSLVKVLANKYERNRYYRTLCINFHGITCKVCNFDFKKFYGAIGDGFIHIHHITPVSKLGPSYMINPIEDLVPVCPNCHSMLHTSDPPLTIENLRQIMEATKSKLDT